MLRQQHAETSMAAKSTICKFAMTWFLQLPRYLLFWAAVRQRHPKAKVRNGPQLPHPNSASTQTQAYLIPAGVFPFVKRLIRFSIDVARLYMLLEKCPIELDVMVVDFRSRYPPLGFPNHLLATAFRCVLEV